MGKVHTEFGNGGRFYVADDNPGISVPGVTSVLGMIPKPFLQAWSAKMAAELAVDSFSFLEQMSRRDPKGAVDYIKGAAQRYTKQRSGIGSDAHDLFERLIRGEHVDAPDDSDDMAPYYHNFVEFLDAVQPELVDAENVVWDDVNGVAGSFDAILRIKVNPETKKIDPDGESKVVIVDWKTSRSAYPDVALQMSGYAHGTRIIDAEGNESPVPELDGAAVLHITETQWAFKSVRVDDEVHGVFLACLEFFKVMQRWDHGKEAINRSVLGRPLAKSARRIQTGTERRGK